MSRTQISVNSKLTVPSYKPDIQSILRLYAKPVIDKTITMKKKILFAGHVDMYAEYVASTSDCTQHIHFWHTEIPFNGLLLHPAAKERCTAWLRTKIIFLKADLSCPRTINTIIIAAVAKVKLSRRPPTPKNCFYPGMDTEAQYPAPLFGNYAYHTPSSLECVPQPGSSTAPPLAPGCKLPGSSASSKSPVDATCSPSYNSAEVLPPPVINTSCHEPSHSHSSGNYVEYHVSPVKPPSASLPSDSNSPYPADTTAPLPHYNYKIYHSGYSKPENRTPVFADDYHTPADVRPYTIVGIGHGAAFAGSVNL